MASIDNLFLIGKYNPNAFEVNKNATIEFGKLAKMQMLYHIEVVQIIFILLEPGT